ncbi:MAG: primosomal protein N' [Cryobacterium sp.]|nr:primosomal protein N' [Oligoflexia bacterium]
MGAVDSVIQSLEIVSVAVPRPIDSFFTYSVPAEMTGLLSKGSWVRVPFGRSNVVGFVVDTPKTRAELPPSLDPAKLKAITEAGSIEDRIPTDVFELCRWASKYYAQPLGELLAAACPPASLGLRSTKRAAKELSRNTVEQREIHLNDEQKIALEELDAHRKGSSLSKVSLLHGVTGSGKTEVYIELAKRVLSEGKGVLLLVPEIALTSQLHSRLESGIGESVARWHSAMPDGQRRDQGAALRCGEIRVVVGARSAVFAPIKNLGLILVDEEHDPTYKQDDRVRYHARDLSIVRGKSLDALVVLGSATPSLETRERVREGKYHSSVLSARFASGGMPTIEIVDLGEEIRVEGIQAALAEKTLTVMRETLARGEQIMIYLNRRGFAAFLRCRDCGEVSECPNCSISLTVHKRSRELRCHVCGHAEGIPDFCPKCQAVDLDPIGAGTESLEEELPKILPDAKILRLDRDAITSATRLEKTLDAFRNGEAQILLGTQMLAKGHDFPKVTLVVVILADALFRYPDFRAPERALQILSQVSGRAGRGELPGRVLVQTYQPDSPILEVLLGNRSEESFLAEECELRQALDYPPFGRLARLRIESSDRIEAVSRCEAIANSLRQVQSQLETTQPDLRLQILGPSEAFLERAKGIYRWDLLIKCSAVGALSQTILAAKQYASREKWTLLVDVDPYGLG